MKVNSQKCFLSIDLECFKTTSFYKSSYKSFDTVRTTEKNTLIILELLKKKDVKATFFVVGQVAKDNPLLIKEICNQGHEIANHSFSHKALWNLSYSDAQNEILSTNEVLQNITGKKVIGFRAPFASLDHRSYWLPSFLEKEGFLYDSSIFPMKTFRHGIQNASKKIYRIVDDDLCKGSIQSNLLEIPFSIYNEKFFQVPCSGGIYARFLPFHLLNHYLKECLEQHGHINFYFHPWEINKLYGFQYKSKIHKFLAEYNSENYLSKIDKVLSSYNFSSFEKLLFK
jgi:polysaccharide deacetylase family protein (PEP-CTERM system associated)